MSERVEIVISAKDQASSITERVAASFNKFKTSVQNVLGVTPKLKQSTDELSDSMLFIGKTTRDTQKPLDDAGKSAMSLGDTWKKLKGTILPAIAAITAAVIAMKKAIEFAKEAAAFSRLEESSAAMARSLGLDMSKIVDAVRTASKGMVSDADIMASATRALMLGVGTSAEQMAQLMEVAAVRGRAMGISTTQAFNDIVTGIGRQSRMILDNLGIILDLDKVYADYAVTLGITKKALSEAQKKEAIVQAVIKDTQGLLKETGGLLVDAAGEWEKLSAAESNWATASKKSLLKAGTAWAVYWANFFEGSTQLINVRGKMQAAINAEIMSEEELGRAVALLRYGSLADLEEFYDGIQPRMDNYIWRTEELVNVFNEDLRPATLDVIEAQRDLAEAYTATDFKSVVSYAQKIDDIYKSIAEKQHEINVLATGFTLKGVEISAEEAQTKIEGLRGEIGNLQQSMTDMANQVVLDMMMATIAVDNITKAEATAYFTMAADMKLISKEAAAQAIQDYGEAIDLINSLEIANKSGNIDIFVKYHGVKTAADLGYEEYQGPGSPGYVPPVPPVAAPPVAPPSGGGDWIKMGPGDTPGKWWWKNTVTGYWEERAKGGKVQKGKGYLVGEEGVEKFIPSESGTILPNSALGGSLNLTVNINTAINLADRAFVENTLMPYIENGVRQIMARGM